MQRLSTKAPPPFRAGTPAGCCASHIRSDASQGHGRPIPAVRAERLSLGSPWHCATPTRAYAARPRAFPGYATATCSPVAPWLLRRVLLLGRAWNRPLRSLEAHLRMGAVAEQLVRGRAAAAKRHRLLGGVDV